MRNLLVAAVVLAVASWASGDVILDNIGDLTDPNDLTGNTHAAQDFEADFDVYDCAVIDNFEIPGDGWTVESIEALLGFWNPGDATIDDPTGYNLAIFSDSALISTTLTGDVAHIASVAYTTGDVDAGLVQFDVNIALDAGTYWVSVQAVMDYGVAGQVGVRSSYLGDLNGIQGNPGGGFGIPGGQQALVVGDPPFPVSAAYRITGVPEPGSLLLLGLAGLLLRRR